MGELKEAWEDYFRVQSAWQRYFKKKRIKRLLEIPLVFLFSFIFIYLFLTFPTQFIKAKWFFKHIGKEEKEVIFQLPQIGERELFLPTIKERYEKEPKIPETPERPGLPSLASLENNTLFIPKINIKAPIIWNSGPEEKKMLKDLENGVVHYKGTALPNEVGNIFIAGHSSGAWWRPGRYKTVFALLDKLKEGDEIALVYENKIYLYRVFEKMVVKPSDVFVLKQTNEKILSLMTCVPVGTDLRRLIVRAKQI